MKKRIIPILLLCILLLVGCSGNYIFQVEQDGYALSVDTQERTITYGDDVYSYRHSSSAMETTVVISYPNEVTYKKTFVATIGIMVDGNEITSDPLYPEEEGKYSAELDESRYIPGLTLAKAVRKAVSQEEKQTEKQQKAAGMGILAVLLMGLGFVEFRFPEFFWYMKHWWCVDGGEPSDMYLDMSRFSGVIFMIAGVICLLVGCV